MSLNNPVASMRISPTGSTVISSIDEKSKLKNSLYYEILFLKNLHPVLSDLQKRLFFAIPEGLLDTHLRFKKEFPKIQLAFRGDDRDELDLALNKAALLRSQMCGHCLAFFSEEVSSLFKIPINFHPLRQAITNLEKDLEQILTAGSQNSSLQINVKTNFERFQSDFEEFKFTFEKEINHFKKLSSEERSLLYKEQMAKEEYAKVYPILCELYTFLGPQKIILPPEQTASHLSCLFNLNSLLPYLIQTKHRYINSITTQGEEVFGEDYPKILRLQKACLVQEQWIKALVAIENKYSEERGGWHYTYQVMQILRNDKLAFYHNYFCKNEALTYAALSRINSQATIANLQETSNMLEAIIDKKESSLKCYSGDKALCSFALLTITKNIFFSLGKEFFLLAEKSAPGPGLDEPLRSVFSHLAGGIALGGQIYLSPKVAGSALLLHSVAQAALSSTKHLIYYGNKLFGLSEEHVFENYSTLLFASSFAVSLLTWRPEGVAKHCFQLGCSILASHYAAKTVDHFFSTKQSTASIKLISTLAANVFGYYLGSLAWQTGEDLAFEHFSNESILFNDNLCTQFQKKCLKEAFKEFAVDEGTPLAQIKALYHSRSLEIHPDKNPNIDPVIFERLAASWKKIQDLYNKPEFQT